MSRLVQPQRNISASTGQFTRLDATTSRGTQLAIGSQTGQVINAAGSATASYTDSMTHINLPNPSDILTVTLPSPPSDQSGITKMFVMDAPGNVTILSNGGAQSIRLAYQGQCALLSWSGSQWVILSSSQIGSVPDSFNWLSVNSAYLEVAAVFNAGPLLGRVSVGAAFFVTADGYAATAGHVIMNDETDPSLGFADLVVHVINYNGVSGLHVDVWIPGTFTLVDGGVIGLDGCADVAVFKVPGLTNQQFLTWGNTRSLQYGETIHAIGNPLNSDFSSVGTGHVRDIKYWDRFMYNQDTLFYDQSLPGNSGGPVMDGQSRVVGISSWGVSSNTTPTLQRPSSATIDWATSSAIDAGYTSGPPGTLSGTVNNTPLQIEDHVFTVADVGTTTFLVKDGTFNSVTPGSPSLDYRTNGTYVYTAVETAGSTWQAERISPFTEADVAILGVIYGCGPTVNAVPGLYPSSVRITFGPANGNTTQTLINSVGQLDPLQDNLIFEDGSAPGVTLSYFESTLAGAVSQHQAQPIVEQIIAGNLAFPAPNPVLNSFNVYNQKGWLGARFIPWTTTNVATYRRVWGPVPAPPMPVYGACLSYVDEGVIDYPIGVPPLGAPQYSPIEIAFDTAFGAPPGLLRAAVTGALAGTPIPIVVAELDGVAIGSQDVGEYPIAQVLYTNPPGTTVDMVLADPFGLLFGPPGTAVLIPVTLGTMPLNLDFALSDSTSFIESTTPRPHRSRQVMKTSELALKKAATAASGSGTRKLPTLVESTISSAISSGKVKTVASYNPSQALATVKRPNASEVSAQVKAQLLQQRSAAVNRRRTVR
jgi:S1-C subfamily serine protease